MAVQTWSINAERPAFFVAMPCNVGHDALMQLLVRVDAQGASYGQNRKYRCAIGSTVAGSHVSNCPSARTV